MLPGQGGNVIRKIRKATDEEWDRMVYSVGSAIYFQTREWFDIWAEHAGFKSDTKLILFDSGKSVLLPLASITLKGLVKCYFTAPKGMGGFVSADELDSEEKRELFEVLKKMKMLYCAANPYDPLTNEFDGFNDEDFTQVLDLGAGFDALFKKWTWGHYSRTRKALREGLTAEEAATENDWKAYFELYQDTLARWGEKATNTYTWDLFATMYRKKSPGIRLWLARHQGQIISGALCFYHNRHVAYWHSATAQQFFKKLNATHVLQYAIIKDACEKRFLLYDFLPSSGIEGVIDFKSGFSPQRKPVHIYMSSLMKLSDTMRKRLRNSMVYKFLMKGTGF
ncbi:MAG: GNAT family N-acetyltransferase [Nitrospirae bacterium]|nr:GNAT family N-acetyltransferase [Nitrospirota bacterium]